MKGRNRTIDILKSFCMLFVVITHCHFSATQRNNFLFDFWVGMAVPIFILISGYVYSNAFKKRQVESLKDAYTKRYIFSKLNRFLVPYIIIFLVEIILLIILKRNLSVLYVLKLFFRGGVGPGSYYVPIMVQFIFLFPLLYMLSKKMNNKYLFLLVMFVLNLLFEIFKTLISMPSSTYRLLIFRYIFLIGLGIFCFSNKVEKNAQNIFLSCCLSALGIFFIVWTTYLGHTVMFFEYWTSTSMLASLYLVPIIFLIQNVNKGNKFFQYISNATFHIYLIQVVYFKFLYSIISSGYNSIVLDVLISIAITFSLGTIFYYLENLVRKKLKNLSKTSNIN